MSILVQFESTNAKEINIGYIMGHNGTMVHKAVQNVEMNPTVEKVNEGC